MRNKKLSTVITSLALALVIAGCSTPTPQISGKDSRLLKYHEQQQKPYQPSTPSYEPGYEPSSSVKGKRILIDPGHGGKDPGTLGIKMGGSYGIQEKEVNLDVAKKVAAKLNQMGARVRLTRTGDTFIELDNRAAMVNRHNADILVSIHADYIGDSSISGPSCYIARNASPQSRTIAQAILREFEKNGIQTRGLRKADYRVLVRHSKPSTLVEIGYMSNYREAKMLNTASYRSKIAEILAKGIANSF